MDNKRSNGKASSRRQKCCFAEDDEDLLDKEGNE